MSRQFHRTVITVEVLSEEPYEFDDLEQTYQDIVTGDCSGTAKVTATETVDGPTMAKLLINQGSDPEFFRLDENGNDADEQPNNTERAKCPQCGLPTVPDHQDLTPENKLCDKCYETNSN
jgi:formylmethanofuran dehydrogenase subunit E